MLERDAELNGLRQRLKEFEGASPAKPVEPQEVGVSLFANRHEDEFTTPEFVALRTEIESAGRNVQPIMVRPVQGRGKVRWEVVYGHRRLRACQDLGIPVWIIEVDIDDQTLFLFMDMENRQRKNPSPWEVGDSYRRALEQKLFPSLKQLSAKLKVDIGYASRAMTLATLPAEVVEAFPSRQDLQFKWGKELSDALQRNPEKVLALAKSIKTAGQKRTPVQVLNDLVGKVASDPSKLDLRVSADSPSCGSLSVDSSGAVTVKLKPGAWDAKKLKSLQDAIVNVLKE